MHRSLEINTATGKHDLQITHAGRLDFYFHNILLSDEFMIKRGISEEVIIGVKQPAKVGHQAEH